MQVNSEMIAVLEEGKSLGDSRSGSNAALSNFVNTLISWNLYVYATPGQTATKGQQIPNVKTEPH